MIAPWVLGQLSGSWAGPWIRSRSGPRWKSVAGPWMETWPWLPPAPLAGSRWWSRPWTLSRSERWIRSQSVRSAGRPT